VQGVSIPDSINACEEGRLHLVWRRRDRCHEPNQLTAARLSDEHPDDCHPQRCLHRPSPHRHRETVRSRPSAAVSEPSTRCGKHLVIAAIDLFASHTMCTTAASQVMPAACTVISALRADVTAGKLYDWNAIVIEELLIQFGAWEHAYHCRPSP
jgi:hypothetical protein